MQTYWNYFMKNIVQFLYINPRIKNQYMAQTFTFFSHLKVTAGLSDYANKKHTFFHFSIHS